MLQFGFLSPNVKKMTRLGLFLFSLLIVSVWILSLIHI